VCEEALTLSVLGFDLLGLPYALGQKADQHDVLQRTLGVLVKEIVCARVANAEHDALVEVHHAFLLVLVGLIREVVKGQDRVVRREDGSHQRGAIQTGADQTSPGQGS